MEGGHVPWGSVEESSGIVGLSQLCLKRAQLFIRKLWDAIGTNKINSG